MRSPKLHLVSPADLHEFLQSGDLVQGLRSAAQAVGADLDILGVYGHGDTPSLQGTHVVPITHSRQVVGQLSIESGLQESGIPELLTALQSILAFAAGREEAVADLASQLCASYEELNLIYHLLPSVAAKTDETDIARLLVEQTASTLGCSRVSLLVLDPTRSHLRVLAAQGLPEEAWKATIPLTNTIAGRAVTATEPFIVTDIHSRPDLAELSQGLYNSGSFAVIRVPLAARGEPIGALMATERLNQPEFTARDCKLLESLASMGASALMHCRLHGRMSQQMLCTIKALACAVDAKDHYTHDHSNRVAQLCLATAQTMQLVAPGMLRRIELAASLHDIGKIGIPDAILGKPGRLSPQEFEVVRCHVNTGADIVGKVSGLEDVAQAILHHHERYDGLGYPEGLSGDAIPILSRLIAVADSFDSLTSNRPYRKASSKDAALSELRMCMGTQLDPAVVTAFRTALEGNVDAGLEAARA